MALQLVIGDRNYSSWSLRAALVLDLSGQAFSDIPVALYRPESRARLLSYSPTGKVPVLLTDEGPVWDSLAIAEYLAEVAPKAQLWPQERYARALARSICAEMHSGFQALRSHLPMDMARDQALAQLPEAVQGGHRSDLRDLGRLPRALRPGRSLPVRSARRRRCLLRAGGVAPAQLSG